jgi:hypothetical protein
MKASIYIFTIFLLISCVPEKSTCSDFHVGKFAYADPDYAHIEIIRTEKTQIEVNSKSKVEAHTSIEWKSDCKYVLTYEKFKNAPEEFQSMIGQKIHAEIIEIGKDKFTCQVKSKNSNEVMDFKVIKD